MRPIETNPRFTNPLVNSASLYLRQHAHNPVFWYPWGAEAIERARAENKPILLSIGYSSCYWCHVMEREVFQNLSIASSMNQQLINIKVDREERPDLDEIYMVARQLMTHEGGWPNNVFLTPDLKPFYAGGTFAPDESYGRPAFPRLLEWVNYSWTTQEFEVRATAQKITESMQPHLVFSASPNLSAKMNAGRQSGELFAILRKAFDGRSGGFYQAPKFPQECWLSFLLGLYENTNQNEQPFEDNAEALRMVNKTLQKMATGGMYDHVGCGFHRYAIDKDWLVPHFEKMLYNQAMLARLYTDAARLTGNPYFADIAKSVLDMVRGPFTDANGGFYTAIDAEVDEVEGAYYTWKPEELESVLTEEERGFMISIYALADVPNFPGHKPNDAQVIMARRPLDDTAKQYNISYLQLSAMSGQLMNKLLGVRNLRTAPALDDKIIVGWNGLMIDAYAHAGRVFNMPVYLLTARRAVDFLLEHAIDNDGNLKRMYASGHAQLAATLEDYAYLIKGIISLWRATPDDILLESARNLAASVDVLFADEQGAAYFYSQPSDRIIIRSRNCDDMTLPNANAVMAHNLIDLFEVTGEDIYKTKARALCEFFLAGDPKITTEYATILHASIRLETMENGKLLDKPQVFDKTNRAGDRESESHDAVKVDIVFKPDNVKPGDDCEVVITLDIKEGWHINANKVNHSFLIPTQVDVQGNQVASPHWHFPQPLMIENTSEDGVMPTYQGKAEIVAHFRLEKGEKRDPIRVLLRFQPCNASACFKTQDLSFVF